ncbi:hypothetical protein [Scytonema sp. NUACC21]
MLMFDEAALAGFLINSLLLSWFASSVECQLIGRKCDRSFAELS